MSAHAMKMLNTLLLGLVAAFSATAIAGEDSIKLKEGAGHDTVMANCIMCHSLDYIPMNSFLKKPNWQATVDKMVKVMGAPIRQDDIPVIVEYLTKYYGAK